MTYEELIQRIVLHARLPGGYNDTMLAESIAPAAFTEVGRRVAADECKRSLLKRQKSITMTAGVGAIPTDVLTEYMKDSLLLDTADLTKEYSWVKDFSDFIGPLDTRLGYYTIRGETTLLQREPGEDYDGTLQFSGPIQLTVPCIPVIPAAHTDIVDVAPEVNALIVVVAADMVRGVAA